MTIDTIAKTIELVLREYGYTGTISKMMLDGRVIPPTPEAMAQAIAEAIIRCPDCDGPADQRVEAGLKCSRCAYGL